MAVNFFFFACKSQQSVQASEFKTKNLHKLEEIHARLQTCFVSLQPVSASGLLTLIRVIILCHSEDIHKYYPNMFIQRDDTDRFYILNSLFNLSGIKSCTLLYFV